MPEQSYDKDKSYRATLTEGLTFCLGARRFQKGIPQKVDGEVAAILSTKNYPSDITKAKGKVETVPVYYFELEECEADEEVEVPAAAKAPAGRDDKNKGDLIAKPAAAPRARTVRHAAADKSKETK